MRDVDASIVAAVPNARAWPKALTHDEKLDLNNRVLTQLLLGEAVEVIDEHEGWSKVVAPWQPSDRDPRGYPGWLPTAHLGAAPQPSDKHAVVAVEAAPLTAEPHRTSNPIGEAFYGTILPVIAEADDAVKVSLPDGAAGWLDRGFFAVRKKQNAEPLDPTAIVTTARRFIGLEYLWGGTCAFGLDCSGLVHLTFRALGHTVPRDAHDQAAAGSRLPREEARAGDLLFFAMPGKSIHHVGFALDDPDRILHAPGTGQHVVDEVMSESRRATVLDYVARFPA